MDGYMWVVEVCTHDIDHDEAVEKLIGREADSAGAGYGVRDLEWEFDTEEEAVQAAGRVQAAGYTEVACYDDDAEEDDD